MIILTIGIIIFLSVHLIPSFVTLRSGIISKLGAGGYKGLFSIISAIGFVLIIIGKSKAEFQPVWQPPVWSNNAAIILMPLSFVLLAAANLKSNIKRLTRHPMLWGVTIWSGVHLLSNGDVASIILFGSFGAFALFDMFSANLRGAEHQTTLYPLKNNIIVVVAGIVTYAAFLFLHSYFSGVAIL